MPLRLPRRQHGFTYLGLVVLVTVIGLVGAATLKIDSLLHRAAAEEELLAVGAAFSAALESYAAATPPGQPPQPPSLQELLKDPRTPGLRRHLRKLFVDPMTGGTEWGIVWLGDHARVVGVYSLSQARPLKVGNFDARFAGFENKQHFSDWKFMTAATAPLPVPRPAAVTARAPEVPAAQPVPDAQPVRVPGEQPVPDAQPPAPPEEEEKPDDKGEDKPVDPPPAKEE
jgi:type II secretory pathway pseudopilin PulG